VAPVKKKGNQFPGSEIKGRNASPATVVEGEATGRKDGEKEKSKRKGKGSWGITPKSP